MDTREKVNSTVTFETEPPAGPIGSAGILFICMGTVLGGGIISLLPTAITQGGGIAGLLFPLCAIIGTFFLAPFIIACRCVRLGGGGVSLVGGLLRGKYTFITGCYSFIVCFAILSVATYGASLGNYIKAVFPNTNVMLVAAIATTAFMGLHMMGVDLFAKVQSIMMPILLVGLAIFAVAGLTHINQPIFDTSLPSFMPNGLAGVFAAWMVMMNCCTSAQGTIYQGRNATDAKRDIPRGILITQIFIVILYAICGIVAVGVVPPGELNGTLVSVAYAIFPSWFATIWTLVVPGLLVLTTYNGLYSQFTMQLFQLGMDGWLPSVFQKKNKRGAPWICVLTVFAIAIIPTLLDWNINTILSQVNVTMFVGDLIVGILLFKLPTVFAKSWEMRMNWLPKGVYYLICAISLVIKAAMAITGFLNLTTMTIIINVCVFVAIFIWVGIVDKKNGGHIRISCWGEEN